jgi:hypothetical protein
MLLPGQQGDARNVVGGGPSLHQVILTVRGNATTGQEPHD